MYGPVAQLRTGPSGTVYGRTQLILERPSRPYDDIIKSDSIMKLA